MLGGASFASPFRLDRALSDFVVVVVVMLWVEPKPVGFFVMVWATIIENPAEREYQQSTYNQ